MDQMGEDALGHGAAADVAVADEKNLDFSHISSIFGLFKPFYLSSFFTYSGIFWHIFAYFCHQFW